MAPARSACEAAGALPLCLREQSPGKVLPVGSCRLIREDPVDGRLEAWQSVGPDPVTGVEFAETLVEAVAEHQNLDEALDGIGEPVLPDSRLGVGIELRATVHLFAGGREDLDDQVRRAVDH